MSKTKKLAICSLLVSLSTVLMLISKNLPVHWLQGGSITIASMVPIVLTSIITDLKYGILSGVAFSAIQMIAGFYPPPTQNFINFVLVIALDYIIAFGILGTAKFFCTILGNNRFAIPISGAIVTSLRYICHILSGILIWGVYAKEGQSVLTYSILYNGSYMIPEIIITTVALIPVSSLLKNNHIV